MTVESKLAATVVRPVIVGWLDIKDDPVYGWTGPGIFAPSGTGDSTLDSNTFLSVAGAIQISDFREGANGSGGVSLTFSGEDNDAPVIKQIVRDRRAWQLRRAKIWLFFLNQDMATVSPDFTQLFSGIMVNASTARQPGSPATISIDLDLDAGKTQGASARLVDHRRFETTDTFSSYVIDLSNGKPVTTGAPKATGGLVTPQSIGAGQARSKGRGGTYSLA